MVAFLVAVEVVICQQTENLISTGNWQVQYSGNKALLIITNTIYLL